MTAWSIKRILEKCLYFFNLHVLNELEKQSSYEALLNMFSVSATNISPIMQSSGFHNISYFSLSVFAFLALSKK